MVWFSLNCPKKHRPAWVKANWVKANWAKANLVGQERPIRGRPSRRFLRRIHLRISTNCWIASRFVRRKPDVRWRTAAGSAPVARDLARSTETRTQARVSDTAEPEPDAEDVLANNTDSESEMLFREPKGPERSRFRLFLLLGCGLVVGIGAAIGVSAWILAHSAPSNAAVIAESQGSPDAAIMAEPVAVNQSSRGRQDHRPLDNHNDEVPLTPLPALDHVKPVIETPLGAGHQKGLGSADTLARVDDPDSEIAAGLVVDGANPDSTDAAESAPTLDKNDEPVIEGDELAEFARWLQSPPSVASNAIVDDSAASPPGAQDASRQKPSHSPTSTARVTLQPTRTPPPPVNVESRLRNDISALRLDSVPLVEAVRLVSAISGIPMSIDPDALGRRNRRSDIPVSLNVRNESVRGILGEVLSKTGLAFHVADGQLRITTQPEVDGRLVTQRYRIDDLTNGDPSTGRVFASWITQLFHPGSWQDSDGEQSDPPDSSKGKCFVDDGTTLVVTHRDIVLYEILAFCETLRVARGLPTKTPILEERIQLGNSRIPNALHQPIDLRLWQESDLSEIVSEIEEQVSIRILVDWSEVYRAGWTPEDRFSLLALKQPLTKVLDEFLRPRGLAYRIVDGKTLEITSANAVATTTSVEVYNVEGNVSAGEQAALSKRIVERIGPELFEDDGPAALRFYEGILIAALPIEQQEMIPVLLSE